MRTDRLRRVILICAAAVIGVSAPIAVFKANTRRAAERLVREINRHGPAFDPPGSTNSFPPCFASVLATAPTLRSTPEADHCGEFERGALPRADMPASCRANLDALTRWTSKALACAQTDEANPRLPLLEALEEPRFTNYWPSREWMRRAARDAIAAARDRNDAKSALEWCNALLRFDARFVHFGYWSQAPIIRVIETDCPWAAKAGDGPERARLRATTQQMLAARPTTEHALEDYLLFSRAGVFGGYASAESVEQLPPLVRPFMSTETLTPDHIPRVRHFLTELSWPAADRATDDLLAHSGRVRQRLQAHC